MSPFSGHRHFLCTGVEEVAVIGALTAGETAGAVVATEAAFAAGGAYSAASLEAIAASEGLAVAGGSGAAASGAGLTQAYVGANALSAQVAAGTGGGLASGATLPDWMTGKVGQTVLGQVAGSAVSSVLGSKGTPNVRGAPAIPGVTPMPLTNDVAVANARRKSLAVQTQRQGRASTILSGGSETLGG